MKKYAIILILAFPFFVTTMGCSATATKRSIGQVIDDAVISNKLKIRYFKDKVVKGFRVNVDTWKGIVTLKGKASTQQQINRAIEIAERQHGVREVKSYLVLGTSGSIKEAPLKKDETVLEEKDITESKDQDLQFDDIPPPSERSDKGKQSKLKSGEEISQLEVGDEASLDGPPQVTAD